MANRYATLGGNDLRLLRRDGLLLYALIAPVVLAVITRWATPLLAQRLAPDFDLVPYYSAFVGMLLLVLPQIFGMMASFFILDERDEQVLLALRTTPLPAHTYVVYRVASAMALCFGGAYPMVVIAGLVPIPWLGLLPVALLLALNAPIIALVVATFAENKVKGLAIVKGLGLVIALPVLVLFVDQRWEPLFWLVPSYWPFKVWLLALADDARLWLYALAGVVYNALLLLGLLRRFSRQSEH
jgi:fluoroquinolone transport system permease protein